MDPRNDFLEIPSRSRHEELPMASIEPAKNPEAAIAARARIAAITSPAEVAIVGAAAVHPKILVTNRAELARATPVKGIPRRVIPSAWRPMLTAVGVFALILLMFKSPVIWSQVQYSLNKPVASPLVLPVAGSVIPAEPTITIPKINVHAPVAYEPSVVEANVQKALENGVVHYGNTAYPGQNGNLVIFGHSSNDWWEPGNYKFVFVLLDKLVPGDQFTIDYQSQRYTYEVTGSTVVLPTDVGVLNQTAEPTATLITCTPPGTSLKRLVVSAKQISPATKTAVAKTTPAPSPESKTKLPGNSAGFFDQVGQVLNGIGQGITSLFGGAKSTSAPVESTSGEIPAVK
jgi:LPXTG-site transpeptidase (sortase) family protein